MYDYIQISKLNDFIFCPRSLYFHEVYESFDVEVYHQKPQTNGRLKHERIDRKNYTTKKNVLVGEEVYCQKYGLIGKIDLFFSQKGLLVERKAKVKQIFDGYVFQLFAQKLCLEEIGHEVKKMEIRSLEDNKIYPIEESEEMWAKFFKLLEDIRSYDFAKDSTLYQPKNKCDNCIYRPLCH